MHPVPPAPGKLLGWLDSQWVGLEVLDSGNLEKNITGIWLVDPQGGDSCSAQSAPLSGSRGFLVFLATQSSASEAGEETVLPDLVPGTIKNSRSIFLPIA